MGRNEHSCSISYLDCLFFKLSSDLNHMWPDHLLLTDHFLAVYTSFTK